MKTLCILCAAPLLLLAPNALAGPYEKAVMAPLEPESSLQFYFFGYGGLNWAQKTVGSAPGLNIDLETETGWTAGGGLGFRSDFLGGSRIEAEGFQKSEHLENVVVNGVAHPLLDNGDEFNAAGVYINLIKEFPIFPNGPLIYAGAGGGWSSVEAEARWPGAEINDEVELFIWQIIAGIEFPVTERLSLYSEYRLTPLTNFTFERQSPPPPFSLEFDDATFHSVVFGLRFYF